MFYTKISIYASLLPTVILGGAHNEECSWAEQRSTLQEIMKIKMLVNNPHNAEPGLSVQHSSSYLTVPKATIIQKKIT